MTEQSLGSEVVEQASGPEVAEADVTKATNEEEVFVEGEQVSGVAEEQAVEEEPWTSARQSNFEERVAGAEDEQPEEEMQEEEEADESSQETEETEDEPWTSTRQSTFEERIIDQYVIETYPQTPEVDGPDASEGADAGRQQQQLQEEVENQPAAQVEAEEVDEEVEEEVVISSSWNNAAAGATAEEKFNASLQEDFLSNFENDLMHRSYDQQQTPGASFLSLFFPFFARRRPSREKEPGGCGRRVMFC